MLSFRDCTLAHLEKTFGIKQVATLDCLDTWLQGRADISEMETEVIRTFRAKLMVNVHDWNETELAYNFIGPIIALVDYTTERTNFFAERAFTGVVDGIEMGGKPDGMIASGFREPETPYFCFQEYKKEQDPEGDPAGQALAAMLVAQELNRHQHPVYGCFVSGRYWNFLALHERQYALSDSYVATRDDVFDIFRILRVLKQMIVEFVKQDAAVTSE